MVTHNLSKSDLESTLQSPAAELKLTTGEWQCTECYKTNSVAETVCQHCRRCIHTPGDAFPQRVDPLCPSCGSRMRDNTAYYLCESARCMKAWTPVTLSVPTEWKEVALTTGVPRHKAEGRQ